MNSETFDEKLKVFREPSKLIPNDVLDKSSVGSYIQVYVHVPTEMGKDGICQTLKQLNFAVRRDTYFRDMKRSNKSRLHF